MPVPFGVKNILLSVLFVAIILALKSKLLSTVTLDSASPVADSVIATALFVVNAIVLFVGCASTFVNLFAE